MTDAQWRIIIPELCRYVKDFDGDSTQDVLVLEDKLAGAGLSSKDAVRFTTLAMNLRTTFVVSLRDYTDIKIKENFEMLRNVLDVLPSASSVLHAKVTSESHAEKTMGDEIRIGGDVSNSAIGSSARFKAHDVTSFKQVIAGTALDDELKAVLVQAREALEVADLSPGDKEDVTDDIAKITAELLSVAQVRSSSFQ
jgi:hypothetical protein